ncbi:aldo/keto reductase [Streptomyces sp. NPDC004230]
MNRRVDVGWSPVDEDSARAALEAGRQAGITLFDAADVYGHGLSEKRLGRMLADPWSSSLTCRRCPPPTGSAPSMPCSR